MDKFCIRTFSYVCVDCWHTSCCLLITEVQYDVVLHQFTRLRPALLELHVHVAVHSLLLWVLQKSFDRCKTSQPCTNTGSVKNNNEKNFLSICNIKSSVWSFLVFLTQPMRTLLQLKILLCVCPNQRASLIERKQISYFIQHLPIPLFSHFSLGFKNT